MKELPKYDEIKFIGVILGSADCPFCGKFGILRDLRYKNGKVGEICTECAVILARKQINPEKISTGELKALLKDWNRNPGKCEVCGKTEGVTVFNAYGEFEQLCPEHLEQYKKDMADGVTSYAFNPLVG